jgi:hypothetical protein
MPYHLGTHVSAMAAEAARLPPMRPALALTLYRPRPSFAQHWHAYDTSKAWFWQGKKAAKKPPRLA